MSFKFQIKRGNQAPSSGSLDIGEFGYDSTNKKVYIGNGPALNANGVSMDGHGHDIAGVSGLQTSLNNKVGTNTTINLKPLTGNIVLNPSDVGAEPAITPLTAFNKNFGTGNDEIPRGDHGHTDLTNASNIANANTLIKRDASGKARIEHPVSSDDAKTIVTKGYVDALLNGLKVKHSVRCASTINVVLGSVGNIDGIGTVPGDRVLLKHQTLSHQNGIYYHTDINTLARTADADSWDKLISAFVFVESGATQADTGWVCTVDRGGVLNTTPIEWAQFSGKSDTVVEGGDSIISVTKTGATFSVSHALSNATTTTGAVSPTVVKGVGFDGTGHVKAYVTGPLRFIDLSDTPTAHTGHGDKFLKINAGATGVEYVNVLDCGSY